VNVLGHHVTLMMLLGLALFGLELFAFVDAAIRPAQAYIAVSKQTKQFWLVLIGLSSWITLVFGPLGLFGLGLVGIIASGVYLLDVRPALKEVGGGRGRGGNQHMGPYGPW
jgi:Protein of unknown function (DUF2516)